MIRPFLPIDLIDILLQGKSLSNRAKTKGNISRQERRFLTSATLLGQWLNPQGRRSIWVWAKGLRLRGLASARNRSSTSAWEVDRLLLSEDDEECCLSLLERLSLVGEESGVEKVFLRLPEESPLVDAAKEAGFISYITESLYGWERGKAAGYEGTPAYSPRRKQVGDDYRLFELYEACVPAPIRRVEGMTFKEWQEAKERSARKEWVFEKEGSLIGWLRVETSGDIGQFEVMASGEEELEKLVEYSLMFLNGCRYLFCLVPEFQGELARLLQGHSFRQIERYSALVKELTVRAGEPCLMPLGA
ncbi:MAG TPA: hypothetical protein VJ441_03750 [Dehalococcoidia bacterium]|nr:hypothetical protein [Dehalococcoidia bacterium]